MLAGMWQGWRVEEEEEEEEEEERERLFIKKHANCEIAIVILTACD